MHNNCNCLTNDCEVDCVCQRRVGAEVDPARVGGRVLECDPLKTERGPI